MKVRYTKGTQSITADILMDVDVVAAIGSDQKVDVAYDADDRTVFVYPSDGSATGRKVLSGWKLNEWRVASANQELPKSGMIEIDAVVSGNVLMFQLPKELPQARTVHRKPKDAPLTPQGIVEAFQAAMAEYPAVKLKVLAPGVGLITINPNMIKVTE